ncbi:hypothetical protein GCM10007421_26640 [Halopseudomonas oceani]|uniref:Chromosome segregation ATPase n=1 Tax=Halopseudomonas oceani TaxID=1708783 RepID=A0A2P4EUE5_9GAMM|nr:hypothetical protein [Halopseudomonas oceani]POB03065.1 hypothetical protein C1949_11930 [Halopseudomonas oceani]GGE50946.1 hypothetical protein GCM10007421_26640 [Halopseudomonas oceani]
MNTPTKPLLTEAVMFFSERGISKEMLFPEFEALLDGMVAAPEYADETVEAVFLQINTRLQVRSAVFFNLDFDLDGYVNRLWNLPLRQIAERGDRGPDMGGGPIRLVCLGFNKQPQYRPMLWKPGARGNSNDLALVKEAVAHNALGILGEDEEAIRYIAPERLHMAAEDTWYGGGQVNDVDDLIPLTSTPPAAASATAAASGELQRLREQHAQEVRELRKQVEALGTRIKAMALEKEQALVELKGIHADHLEIVQGELLDIKQELAEQQRINAALKRELSKFQNRTASDFE